MDGSESKTYDNLPFGMLQYDDGLGASENARVHSRENFGEPYLPETFSNQAWTTASSTNHIRLQDDSPHSSTSSSPQARIAGNRARASSLNSRLAQSRSTAHMTQQQINKKRQRATAEQLAVLEEAFLINPSPNAKIRETISAQISMTERSVQIWFQNRRAKTKMLHKKIGSDDIPYPPVSQAGRPAPPGRSLSIDHGILPTHLDGPADLVSDSAHDMYVTRLSCRSLTIGSWRRVACTANDLVCYFAHHESKFTYYINSGSSGYMIEYQISAIDAIDLRFLNTPGVKEMGRAVISLNSSPIFFMELPPSGSWKQCTDFTEGQQATTDLNHAIVGPYAQLKQSFAELQSLFKDKIIFNFPDELENPLLDGNMNPNILEHAAQPLQPFAALEQPMASTRTAFTGKLHMPEPSRFPNQSSHRRTRSRSAPIAIDLSLMANRGADKVQDFYGQHRFGSDAFNRYSSEAQVLTNPEFSDGFCTPTTAATSNYQDQWYTSSYANTPLLGADSSQLGSPMILNNAQFDLNAASAYADPFHSFAGMSTHVSPLTALAQHLNSSQPLSDSAMRLDSVPEIPLAETEQYAMDVDESLTSVPMALPAASYMPMTGALMHEEELLPSRDGSQP